MRLVCLFLAALIAGCVAVSGVPQTAKQSVGSVLEDDGTCIHNRAEMLALDVAMFDQSKTTGWRKVASLEGCESAAAGLIAEYRSLASEEASDRLRHHQAQLHAAGEEREEAIVLLEAILGDTGDTAMYAYHSAEIAFLSGDMDQLIASRSMLLALPEPVSFSAGIARFKEKYPEFEPPTWPINLEVIDRFITCFGESYSDAYNSPRCGG